jgi:hypothetical protein
MEREAAQFKASRRTGPMLGTVHVEPFFSEYRGDSPTPEHMLDLRQGTPPTNSDDG